MKNKKTSKEKGPQQKWKPGTTLWLTWQPNGKQYNDGKKRPCLLLKWEGDKCLLLPLSTSSKTQSGYLMPMGDKGGYTKQSTGEYKLNPGSDGLCYPCCPSWDCGLLCTPETWWQKKGNLNPEQWQTLKLKYNQYGKNQLKWQEKQPLPPTN